MLESQQLFFGEQLLSRIFEEYQQPAIKTKIVSCPQNWEHGLKKANRYPNLKRGAPAVFRVRLVCCFLKLKMDEITACRFTNRVQKKMEVEGNSVFSGSEL